MSIIKAFDVLAERESLRVQLSQIKRPPQSEQERFYSVANSIRHRTSNRYSNIFAYDRTAVSVDGEYINANVVKDVNGSWWVASQAPLPSTFDFFFRAIRTRAASRHPLINAKTDGAVLVQLTGWEENGMKKADRYLKNIRRTIDRPDIKSVVTELDVDGQIIQHYHFDAWPDHGVPTGQAVEALRALIKEIKKIGQGKEIWVHCSAGVGRTGAFIAISSLMDGPRGQKVDSPLAPLPNDIDDVARRIDEIRDWRGMLVQNLEQMKLVYNMSGK